MMISMIVSTLLGNMQKKSPDVSVGAFVFTQLLCVNNYTLLNGHILDDINLLYFTVV